MTVQWVKNGWKETPSPGLRDLPEFKLIYGLAKEAAETSFGRAWRKVAADYDGIQIDNFNSRSGNLPHWYRGLDMDSGAIWNASKVRVTLLGKIPHSEMTSGGSGDDFASLMEHDFDFGRRWILLRIIEKLWMNS